MHQGTDWNGGTLDIFIYFSKFWNVLSLQFKGSIVIAIVSCKGSGLAMKAFSSDGGPSNASNVSHLLSVILANAVLAASPRWRHSNLEKRKDIFTDNKTQGSSWRSSPWVRLNLTKLSGKQCKVKCLKTWCQNSRMSQTAKYSILKGRN